MRRQLRAPVRMPRMPAARASRRDPPQDLSDPYGAVPGGGTYWHRLEPAPGAAAVAGGHLGGDLPDGTPPSLIAALAATAGTDGQHAGRARGPEPHRSGPLHTLRLGHAQPA